MTLNPNFEAKNNKKDFPALGVPLGAGDRNWLEPL